MKASVFCCTVKLSDYNITNYADVNSGVCILYKWVKCSGTGVCALKQDNIRSNYDIGINVSRQIFAAKEKLNSKNIL